MAIVFTAIGPLIGFIGLYFDTPIAFWIGVATAAIALFLDLASGATRFPFVHIAIIVGAASFWTPWWYGAALGLLVAAAIETTLHVLERFPIG